MADLIFNPLLKKGFQYDNTAAIQAEIDAMQENLNALQTSLNALQNQKITKCFTAADLAKLEINEIFEWQGDNTIFEGTELINGYFYKYIPSETITITPPKIYYTIDNDIVTNLVTIKSGIFYQNGGTSAHGIVRYNSNTERFFWVYDGQESPAMPHIGELVFDAQNMIFSEIVSVQGDFDSITDNLGNVFTFSDFSTGSGGGTQFNFISSDGLYNYDIANQSDFAWFFIKINGKEAVIVSPRLNTHYTDKPIIITIGGIQQTDTQPRLQNIENASNGDINITQNLNVSGDLNVTGTQRIVHSEEIDSENDFINLRYNNPLALANDEQSGIKVENYDGNNNNCIFGVDNAGWARIGDESGTLQKLATIEESPTDAQFVQYDAQNKQLKTAAIPEATTTAAGLMSATDKVKINSFGEDLWQDITPTLYNSFTGSVKIIQYGRFVNINITFTNTMNVGIKSRIMEIPILCNAISYNYVFWCYSGDDTVPPIPILLGRQNNHITIYLADKYNANNSYTGVFLVLN